MLTRWQKKRNSLIKKIECLICLQPCFSNRVSVCCSGCYHSKCLRYWYRIRKRCPVCKRRISLSEINDEDYNENVNNEI